MIRAVLDTNVLIAAVINTKSSVSQEIYQNFTTQQFLLVTSPKILEEVAEVMYRERIIKRHQRSAKQLKAVINELTNIGYIVSGNTKVEIVRDPDDNKIISAALEGQAQYIVTRDDDLLDLKKYQGIKIITPEEFMGILRSQR